MDDVLVPIVIVGILFIGFPWVLFHYLTRWRQAKTLTGEDEKLLDDLYDTARRLDDRLCTIERIMNAENPAWRQTCLPDSRVPLSDDILSDRARTRTRRGERA